MFTSMFTCRQLGRATFDLRTGLRHGGGRTTVARWAQTPEGPVVRCRGSYTSVKLLLFGVFVAVGSVIKFDTRIPVFE